MLLLAMSDEVAEAAEAAEAAGAVASPHLPVSMRPEEGAIAAMANPTYIGLPPYTGAWAGCAYDPDLPGPLYTPGAPARHAPSPPRALR